MTAHASEGSDHDGSQPLRISFQVWGQYVSWRELMDVGKAIEEMGFDGLWSNDHLLPVIGSESGPVEMASGPVWDAWMTLMGWAAATTRVRLGCMVSSVSFRNPALLVRMATALDHATAGRAVLGIGAGWNATEHRMFGFDFPSLRERLDRLDEASRICRRLLDGRVAHVDGYWYRAEGARNEPGPTGGHLPLLIGGSGERRTLPIVARDADIWNGEGDPESVRHKNACLDDLCEKAGRDPRTIMRTVGLPPPLIRRDRRTAIAEQARLLVRHGLSRRDATVAARSSAFVGSAAQVAERLRAYWDAGADEVAFDWPTPSDEPTLEALATDVRDALSG
jgi:alkanesulfonate monooxygenase SsuD/methylene tetrahydromethanopterin reductase-like flavin-dependent oxidoreductase (luciferase family)